MELRAYWAIIWRRIWIVALVFGVIALFVAYQLYHLKGTPGALRGYTSQVTLRVGLQGTTASNQNTGDQVTAAEALADAFTTGPILTSNEFMAQIVQQIQTDSGQIQGKFGAQADLGDLQDTAVMSKSLTATHVHNLVTLSVNWSTPAGAWAITNAIGEISSTHLNQYLGYVVNTASSATSLAMQAAAQVISAPTDPQAGSGTAFSRAILLLLLLLVGLIIGIALAFLIEYLDDRIYNQNEVSQLLQLPSYGVVPHAPTAGRTIKRSKG